MPQQIRKALIDAVGDESHVNIISTDIDDPARDEVQVRVLYSGFNGGDVNMRLGRYPMQEQPPLTPGYCLVGLVDRNGKGCKQFQPGAIVCALTVYGGQAELTNVPEKYLIQVPPNLDIQKACALVLDWTTAYGMVHRSAKVKHGQRAFVHGLSGAVGLATATLCQLQGAEVYGTASAKHHEPLRSLGFHPFVYTDKHWMNAMKALGGADVAFDPLGYESWDESYDILSHNDACLVGYGHNKATMEDQPDRPKLMATLKLLSKNVICPFPGVHRHTRFFYVDKDDKTFEPELQKLFMLLGQGSIDVKIKGIFDLEDIQEAHRSWTRGSAGVGSMLIRVGDKPQ